jgi:AhpD family alkylhydroperoxidase
MADHFFPHDAQKELQKLRSLKPDLYRAFHEFGQAVFKDASLPNKTKQLIAIGVAHVTQCPWCISGHTRLAKSMGITDEEIAETIFVAMEMRAGAAYAHGSIAMEAVEGHQH